MPHQLTNRRPLDLGLPEKIRDQLSADSFRVRAETSGESIELLVMGFVGDDEQGLDSRSVVELLSANPTKPVRVRINSPGGLAWDGIAVHNALVKHAGEVTVEIEGLAGSAAAVIAVAGDRVKMAANGSMMIHRAWGIVLGNAIELEDTAAWLRKIDAAIAATFAAKAGGDPAKFEELLSGKVDGTWMTAEEAKKLGLVDEILPVRPGGGDAKDAARAEAEAALRAQADRRLIDRQRLLEHEFGRQ